MSHVELGLDEDACRTMLQDDGSVRHVRGLLANLSVTASLHSTGGTNLGEKVARIRQVSIDMVSEAVEVGSKLGAAWVTVHLGSAGFSNASREQKVERLDLAIEGLHQILERTAHSEVRIGLENLPRFPEEWPVCRLGDCWEEFEHVFNRVTSDRAALVFDFGHARLHRRGDPMIASIPPALFRRLVGFHLHSNNGLDDLHTSLRPEDAEELEHFLGVVTRAGVDAPLLLENYSLSEMLESVETLSLLRMPQLMPDDGRFDRATHGHPAVP